MRTKQVRAPKLKYEYELHISCEYDNIKKQDYILFDFRTVKVFKNFIYKINVNTRIDIKNKIIEFNVEGLSSPLMGFSESGYANYQYKLYNFSLDNYTIKLLRYGKSPIDYIIRFSKEKIEILPPPKKTFLQLIIKDKTNQYAS